MSESTINAMFSFVKASFTKALMASVFAVSLLMMTTSAAQAADSYTVDCIVGGGGCSIVPSGPVFLETNILPGDTFTKEVIAKNSSANNGMFAFEAYDLENTGVDALLSEAILIEIRRGAPDGPLVYGPITLSNLVSPDPNYQLLEQVNANSQTSYYFIAEFDSASGNEYQGLASVFDLRLGFELLDTTSNPGNPGGSGSSGSGSSGSTAGSSTAQPPVCNATAPSGAPFLTITNVGANTVSLSWTPVSPVTHYAISFTRNSDGAQYGAANIGNVTSYTITNLSGGANYTFEVFGVNDCAPGPRSNQAGTGTVPGPVLGGQPLGAGGQVLGLEEPDAPATAESGVLGANSGEVAGAIDQVCQDWRLYIPWILLVIQAAFIVFGELYFRRDRRWTKHYLVAGVTLVSIAIFYFVRECDCYTGSWSWLAWLCRWYWIVSLLITAILKLVSYAFIEEVDQKSELSSSTKTQSSSQKASK